MVASVFCMRNTEGSRVLAQRLYRRDVSRQAIGRRYAGRWRIHTIELEYISEGVIRGYSNVLELYLCWEYGRLRFYDPKRGEYLRSLGEQAIRADAEAVRADAEAIRADAEAVRADAEAAEVRRLRRILRERGLE